MNQTMVQLEQLVILLLPVILVTLLLGTVMGLKPGKLGWLLPTARRRRGRPRLIRLTGWSLPKTIITQAVAMADVALLALSTSVLAALGLQQASSSHHTALAVAVIVTGLCLLLIIQLVNEPFGSIVLFGIAAFVTLRIAQLEHADYPLLASVGLMIAVLGPWPVGLVLLVIELGTIAQEEGPATLIIVLALIAALTALGLLVKAAKGALFVIVVICLLVVLALIGVAASS